MTINLDDNPLADDVPAADAAEQHQPADGQRRGRRARPRLRRQPASARRQPSRCDRPSHHRADARRRPRRRHRPVLSTGSSAVVKSHAAARPAPVEQVPPRDTRGDQRGVWDAWFWASATSASAKLRVLTSCAFAVCTISTNAWLRVQPRSAISTPSAVSRIRAPARRGSCDRPDASTSHSPPAYISTLFTHHITCGGNYIFPHR